MFTLSLYRMVAYLLAPVLWGLAWVRAYRGHEETDRLQERRGVSNMTRPSGPLVWIHAASVGEMRSILPLARQLLEQNSHLHILITTVTVTAARLVRQLKNPRIIHQYSPYDHPVWGQRFVDHWQPDTVLWVESELWPNMLAAIKAGKIPLAMINGRISERSAQRWARVPETIRHILSLFDVCLAQSDTDAARLRSLGANHVQLCGNMKYAGRPLSHAADALAALKQMVGARPVILFASTHAGEEAIAIEAYKALLANHPDLLVIIAPRHPQRGADIAGLISGGNLACVRRSAGGEVQPATAFYIADTLGELGLFYSLCPLVFLGNSLINTPGGGHNPIEPAQLGCAIVYGPHMWNFQEIDIALRQVGGALQVRDAASLIAALDKLLQDRARCDAMGQAARHYVENQNSVLENTLKLLRPYLERAKIAA